MRARSASSPLVAAFLVLSCANVARAQLPPSDSASAIEDGARIERPLTAGDLHAFSLPVAAGSFLHIQLELTRIGVAIAVHDPAGNMIAQDTSAFYDGPERLIVPTSTAGMYRIEVKGLGGSGRYEMRVEARSPAVHEERLQEERAAEAAARAWLREHAIPLATVEPGHGFADMQPLRAIVGDARIVALGEATHGTREFFQLKHRMLEFLVEELRFNIFGIEASLPEALEVNHYVLTGEGDPARALAGMYFWVWDTEEVLALIEWMRRYNADPRHTRKVSFYGFDMQFPARAARVALEYLRAVDASAAVAAQPVLEPMTDPFLQERALSDRALEGWQALRTSINEIATRFDEGRADYVAASSAEQWDLARRHVHILQQYTDLYATPDADYDLRDSAMAANVAWMLEREGPDSKAVLWAHNGHVATVPGMMGTFLRRQYGDAMRVFGFAFERGGFQARDVRDPGQLRVFRVPPAPEGTLDAALAAAGLPRAAFDLRALPSSGPVADWFRAAPATRSIGSGFSDDGPGFWWRERLPEAYDALLFVAETEAARPNPATGRRFRLQPVLPRPENTGFEEGAPGTVPPGWWRQQGIAAVEWDAAVTRGDAPEGEHALVIRRAAERRHAETVGQLQQRVDATPWRGQRVTLSAYVRIAPATSADRAYLWIEASAPQGTWSIRVAGDYMVDRPITAVDWRRYEVSILVPENADVLAYGVSAVGDGAVWLDAVALSR